MEPAVNDAVGQPLAAGDVVAHVSRHGSTVSIERRRIAQVAGGRILLVPRENGRNQSSPRLSSRFNMVRLAQGGPL